MNVVGRWSDFGFEEHQCSAQETACAGKIKTETVLEIKNYFYYYCLITTLCAKIGWGFQMRSSRNFCIDIVLLCVILGIVSYIYK